MPIEETTGSTASKLPKVNRFFNAGIAIFASGPSRPRPQAADLRVMPLPVSSSVFGCLILSGVLGPRPNELTVPTSKFSGPFEGPML